MKKINLEFLSDKDYSLVIEEAERLRSLKNDYIIDMQNYFEQNQILYIVMDFAEGGDLQQLLNQKEADNE